MSMFKKLRRSGIFQGFESRIERIKQIARIYPVTGLLPRNEKKRLCRLEIQRGRRYEAEAP